MSEWAVSRYWLRVVAVFEIVGGLSGLLSIAVEAVRAELWFGVTLSRLIPAALFLLSLVAGVQLWRNKRTGYWASIAVQIVQLPKLVTASFAFMMSFGFDVMVLRVPSSGSAGYGLVFNAAVPEYHLWLPGGLGVDAGVGFSIISCVNLRVLLKRLKRLGIADAQPTVATGTLAALGPAQPDQPEWVPPFWMRGCGIILLLIFALCIGLRITLLSSPH